MTKTFLPFIVSSFCQLCFNEFWFWKLSFISAYFSLNHMQDFFKRTELIKKKKKIN